jgi:D-alanyl-D-alanine carboxypeptidase
MVPPAISRRAMMGVKRRGLLVVTGVALLTGLVGATPVAAGERAADRNGHPALSAADEAFIDEQASTTLAGGAPGVTVVVDNDRGRFARSWGRADLATGRALRVRDHHRIGSITKTYVATALLRLVDRGRISLDDRLSRYVPGIPNGDEITVRHLLGMRSGVFNYTSDPAFVSAYLADPSLPGFTPADILPIIGRNPPEFAPGERTSYSNSNYILAGLILEKVTGRSAEAVLRRSVLEPLGLRDTELPTTDRMPRPFAHGYDTTVTPARDVTRSNPAAPWTAGAAVSTAPDLVLGARALVDGRLLSRRLQEERFTFTPIGGSGEASVGYGLGVLRIGDWIGHTGGIAGYTSVAMAHPATGTVIVVLVNATGPGANADSLFLSIARRLVPDSLPDDS